MQFKISIAVFLTTLLASHVAAAPTASPAGAGACHPGKIWAHPHDCHKYLQCGPDGRKIESACGPGTGFNSKTNSCQTQADSSEGLASSSFDQMIKYIEALDGSYDYEEIANRYTIGSYIM
ncbi:hypothetical protein P168DRAFT_303501 [Aspergillus campestris IBT 28561]|uniref:Chitin-binding type-2 domain-containing protein n=1 Tax=Aspergillus campestris (strain IBT 28561) TaxID=1392248 RepID=A0A2I1D7D9_ASPC2|nr:uncharacterized protein P168DRAFT_303501 [Aspergillus campestris IBT 28561]PKY05778.1 hypothetical protein P168DRAFT_303501 [Aspergillus campestris IBT 28561]